MHPELFDFSLPSFLANLLGVEQVTVYTYATFIATGTLIAVIYTKWRAKIEMGVIEIPNIFFYAIFIAGFIGGKLFYYLQDPLYFINNPSLLLDNFNGGYVFYGWFVAIIPYIIWYLKKHNIPVLPMLDILAITTTIVHAIGRLGCFGGGCCYGSPTNSSFGLIFPATNGVKVHPTQLYEALMLVCIMLLLILSRRKKQFNGQIFLIYLILYALGRGVMELFRGDDRGFIIKDILSHSQFIGLCLISISIYFYYKLGKEKKLKITINQ